MSDDYDEFIRLMTAVEDLFKARLKKLSRADLNKLKRGNLDKLSRAVLEQLHELKHTALQLFEGKSYSWTTDDPETVPDVRELAMRVGGTVETIQNGNLQIIFRGPSVQRQ
jgi:hypothetical protein